MRVDFYHLTRDPAPRALASIAARVLANSERLLVVAQDRALLDEVSAALWDAGPSSYLAHDHADAPLPEVQPILLSSTVDALNGARAIALVDGVWRDEAAIFERAFLLFDDEKIEGARTAWRTLGAKAECERHYWKQDGGRWREGP